MSMLVEKHGQDSLDLLITKKVDIKTTSIESKLHPKRHKKTFLSEKNSVGIFNRYEVLQDMQPDNNPETESAEALKEELSSQIPPTTRSKTGGKVIYWGTHKSLYTTLRIGAASSSEWNPYAHGWV